MNLILTFRAKKLKKLSFKSKTDVDLTSNQTRFGGKPIFSQLVKIDSEIIFELRFNLKLIIQKTRKIIKLDTSSSSTKHLSDKNCFTTV